MPRSYLDFLNLLLSFGPKLPAAILLIQEIVAKVQELAALFGAVKPAALRKRSLASVPAKAKAAEAKVLAALKPKRAGLAAGGVFTAGWLQAIWAFLAAHPELLTLLLSLLGKK